MCIRDRDRTLDQFSCGNCRSRTLFCKFTDLVSNNCKSLSCLTCRNWQDREKNAELLNFWKQMIAFRKAHPILHPVEELRILDRLSCGYPDLSYHGQSPILAETSGRKGGPLCKRRATAPRLCTLSASSHPMGQREGPGPHVMQLVRRLLRAKKPHRHLRQCRVFSTAEPVPRLKAALRMTLQRQLSATIHGSVSHGTRRDG